MLAVATQKGKVYTISKVRRKWPKDLVFMLSLPLTMTLATMILQICILIPVIKGTNFSLYWLASCFYISELGIIFTFLKGL